MGSPRPEFLKNPATPFGTNAPYHIGSLWPEGGNADALDHIRRFAGSMACGLYRVSFGGMVHPHPARHSAGGIAHPTDYRETRGLNLGICEEPIFTNERPTTKERKR
jgi:hypothetical protein